ncbi:MAG: hypothetical protein ABIK09_17220 [Pseudomonadota bacterium]
MTRTTALLALLGVAALAGCSNETIQCNGVLVGNTCYPDGAGCQSDQECLPTGVCLGGTCGQECTSKAQCLNGFVCQTYRCVPDGGGPGEDTVVEPPEDTLQDLEAPVPCQNHVDCDPYDMACHFDVGTNNKYCVAVGNACATGQNPCYSGSCLGDAQTGYCTAICNTFADCPGGWSCQDVGGQNACVAP